MNGIPIPQQELQNLLIKINKTSSFVERLHFVLNWTGNDFQKIAFSGVSWFNETSFFIKADQLAPLFGVKTETISASLRHNNFIKQYNPLPNGQRYFWSKPGFSIHGFQTKNQTQNQEPPTSSNQNLPNLDQPSLIIEYNPLELNNNHSYASVSTSSSATVLCPIQSSNDVNEINQEKLITGNDEFDDISNLIFLNSDLLKCSELIEIFYTKFCPVYIEKSNVENTFNDYFNIENCHFQVENPNYEILLINRKEFWVFYQHFGPLNSILTKYNLFKDYSSQKGIPIELSENNKFLVDNKFLVFNDFKRNVGRPFLKDDTGQFYDSWDKIIQNQISLLEIHGPSSSYCSSKFYAHPVLSSNSVK